MYAKIFLAITLHDGRLQICYGVLCSLVLYNFPYGAHAPTVGYWYPQPLRFANLYNGEAVRDNVV